MGGLEDVLDEETGEGEAEDGGGVGYGAVDLGFGGAPLVIEEVLATGTLGGFGTDALGGATTVVFAEVLEEFFAVDAFELLGGEGFLVAELATEGCGKGATFDLPEFGDGDFGGVHLEGGSHGGEEGGIGLSGTKDEVGFVFEGVDGIDDVVVGGEVEGVGGLGTVDGLDGSDLSGGVDVEEALFENIDFNFADGGGGCHELAVDIGGADTVGIDDGEVLDAGTDEALGTP